MTLLRTIQRLSVLWSVALLAVGAPSAIAAGDPFVGTFVMNAARSSANPGPLPQSLSVTTEDLGGGKFRTVGDSVLADGTKEHWEAIYTRDGTDAPVRGNPNVDTIAVRLVDPSTIEVVQKKGGNVVSTVTGKVSADGKTITSTVSGTDPQGNPVSSTIVSERR